MVDLLNRDHVALQVHLMVALLERIQHTHDTVILLPLQLEVHVHDELRGQVLHVETRDRLIGPRVPHLEERVAHNRHRLLRVATPPLHLVHLLHDVRDHVLIVMQSLLILRLRLPVQLQRQQHVIVEIRKRLDALEPALLDQVTDTRPVRQRHVEVVARIRHLAVPHQDLHAEVLVHLLRLIELPLHLRLTDLAAQHPPQMLVQLVAQPQHHLLRQQHLEHISRIVRNLRLPVLRCLMARRKRQRLRLAELRVQRTPRARQLHQIVSQHALLRHRHERLHLRLPRLSHLRYRWRRRHSRFHVSLHLVRVQLHLRNRIRMRIRSSLRLHLRRLSLLVDFLSSSHRNSSNSHARLLRLLLYTHAIIVIDLHYRQVVHYSKQLTFRNGYLNHWDIDRMIFQCEKGIILWIIQTNRQNHNSILFFQYVFSRRKTVTRPLESNRLPSCSNSIKLNMRALLLIALLATVALSMRLQKPTASKIVEELQKTKYGATLLHMVQLHSMAQGPVQELEDAIEELISDLNEELENLEFEFNQRTSQHNSDVISLEQEIQDAEIDVDRSEDTIANLLVPRLNQLQSRLQQLQENIEENRGTLAENTLVREQEHDAYELQVEELNGATAAVDEALSLLDSLSNPSLVQVKKFQNSLNKIQQKINKRGSFTPMIKALVSLASKQNFADQDSLRQISEALNEFRNAVVDSLNDLTLQEQQNQTDFEERVDQLNAEYSEFQRAVNNLTYDLTASADKIEETQNFRNVRYEDKKTYVAQLELENTTYAEETEIFTDLKNEFLRELAVSEQGLSLIQNTDFSNINV